MIIPPEISSKYKEILLSLGRLKTDIDPVLEKIAASLNGLYFSRIKSEESFTQKLEGGKFAADKIIDLFGATIVVATSREVDDVEKKVSEMFKIHKKLANREKAPEEFIYDDVHLIISFEQKNVVPDREYLNREFELQIKTFLQYAWDKATHDLLYKGQTISWSLFRVAYQTKAMLEQADQVLVQIEKTAELCPENEYKAFKDRNRIIELSTKIWEPVQLPADMRRLSSNIYDLLSLSDKGIKFLENELGNPSNKELLTAKSITPYEAILGIVIKRDWKNLLAGFKAANRKIIITKELREIVGLIPAEIEEIVIKLK